MSVTVERTAAAADVHTRLARHLLVDGFDLVLDLERSHGSWLVDARDGTEYLDLFTFFASSALGMNHPALADDPAFRAELLRPRSTSRATPTSTPSPMARFVDTFARVLGDPALPHLFFVEGGALAVENALKVAFDWKTRWNEAHGLDPALRHPGAAPARGLPRPQRLHAVADQHRSRQDRPLPEVRLAADRQPLPPAAVADMDAREAECAAAGAGGLRRAPARHRLLHRRADPGRGRRPPLPPEFLAAMQRAVPRATTRCSSSTRCRPAAASPAPPWAYQQLGLTPDVVAFGKKTQVCGVMAGGRVDEVPDNVFAVSSRINSTWGGELTDMVRSRRILEVVEADGLIARAARDGCLPAAGARRAGPGVRGRGARRAGPRPDVRLQPADHRRSATLVLGALWERGVIMLGSGADSVRFRPALTVTRGEIDRAVAAVREPKRPEKISRSGLGSPVTWQRFPPCLPPDHQP